MFSFICHHFVVGGEEWWIIVIRESCEGGEGEGLKADFIAGLNFSFFIELFIWLHLPPPPNPHLYSRFVLGRHAFYLVA